MIKGFPALPDNWKEAAVFVSRDKREAKAQVMTESGEILTAGIGYNGWLRINLNHPWSDRLQRDQRMYVPGHAVTEIRKEIK